MRRACNFIRPRAAVGSPTVHIRRHWLRHHDWILIVLSGILLFTGWLFIHGTAVRMGGRFENYGMRQAVWIGAGTVVFLILSLMDYRALAPWAWVFCSSAFQAQPREI